jgi:5-methyltetrahydropteroyltriglutamate--homocysteine methyltransferase
MRHVISTYRRYFLVEAGNARHAHEHGPSDMVRYMSAHQVLVPGVIDTKSAYVEHPDLIADRLLRYVGLLGPARVMAATDCGFATTAKVRRKIMID